MSNWIHATLQDICRPEKGSIISGPFGSNISSKFFVDEGVPVIRGNNLSLSLDKFYDDGFVFVTQEKADELNCYALEGDLLFTAAGTIGQVGILEAPLKYEKYVISNKQLRARIDTRKVDLLYAYYWFSSAWMQDYFIRNNKGSTVPLISLSELKDAPISYPEDISEQKRIVAEIEVLSQKIETNRSICAELESMAKTIYDYWFTQFDFPDANGKPYRTSGGAMEWNEEFKCNIPYGWSTVRLSDICTFRNGINYEKGCRGNRTYRIVNVRNITASNYLMDVSDFDEISLLREQADRYVLGEHDIIIARSGTPGATRLIMNPEDNVIFCGFIICCTPNASEYRLFISQYLKKLEGTNATKTGGSILQNVSQDTLKSLLVCLPNKATVEAFNAQIMPLVTKMDNVIRENRELTELRDWLLPMLMNGQATVAE